jgi:hypothetical protein
VTGHNGWLCLGGQEIWNSARLQAYIDNGCAGGRYVRACDSCGPEMAVALEQEGGDYVSPEADPAPWYAATEPYSADFTGFLPLTVDGLGPGPITRETTQRASGRGAFFGPEIQAAPAVVVTGVLVAKTGCAAAYGLRWLTMALRGSCGSDCDGDDLTFLDCCPTWAEGGDPVEEIEPHLRTLKGVRLTSSPTVTDRFGASCRCHDTAPILQVTFTLSAAEPCVFRPPVPVAEDVLFDVENPSPCVTWFPTKPGVPCPGDDTCADPGDCIADPACPPPAPPPAAPPPRNPCICTPFTTVQACAEIPTVTIPEWAEGVPIITLKAGSQDLRQVRGVFIPNPLNQPLEDLDPCNACGEFTLSRIPAGSEFVMDGTSHTVTINCPGRAPTDATPLMGSVNGRLPFAFPEIACGGIAYALCVTADGDRTAADASVSVEIAVRECG